MKESISRRQVLGRGAAAAGLTTALSLQKQLASHGVNSIGPYGPPTEAGHASREHKTFRNFFDWWKQYGEMAAKESARYVSHFDAEILCLQSVSLSAKVEMQRARNFKRIRVERERDFAQTISMRGIFKWWTP